jgi:hypothetical protein
MDLVSTINFLLDNQETIVSAVLSIIGGASVLVKLLPELPENHWAKPAIKFIGKYMALNRKPAGDLSIKVRTTDDE